MEKGIQGRYKTFLSNNFNVRFFAKPLLETLSIFKLLASKDHPSEGSPQEVIEAPAIFMSFSTPPESSSNEIMRFLSGINISPFVRNRALFA